MDSINYTSESQSGLLPNPDDLFYVQDTVILRLSLSRLPLLPPPPGSELRQTANMAGPIICCQDMQLPFSKHANARELYDFEVWARKAPRKPSSASKHIKSLPRGVFGADCYFQVTARPGLANVPSTRTFIPKLNNHKPYQEVLSVAYVERNYKQVAS